MLLVSMKKLKKMQVTKQELDELEKVFQELPEEKQLKIRKIAIDNYIKAIKKYDKALPNNNSTNDARTDDVHLFEKHELCVMDKTFIKLGALGCLGVLGVSCYAFFGAHVELDNLLGGALISSYFGTLATLNALANCGDPWRKVKYYDIPIVLVHPIKYLSSSVHSIGKPRVKRVKDDNYYNAKRLFEITQQEDVSMRESNETPASPEVADQQPEHVVETKSTSSRDDLRYYETPEEVIHEPDNIGIFKEDYSYR